MAELVRKPRGPKPRPREELKRNSITFRALGKLRDRLMVAAGQNGRSLSEEVEDRLEQSFGDATPFGSPETFALMMDLSLRLRALERRFQKPWMDIEDPSFQVEMSRIIEERIAVFRADPELRPITGAEVERIEAEPAMDLSGLDQPMPPGTRALQLEERDKSDVKPKDPDHGPRRALDV